MLRVILIVDDDQDACLSIVGVLEIEGYSCLMATSGSEGLRLLESENPLLVILDFRLPDRR